MTRPNKTKLIRLTLCLIVSAVCLYLAGRGMDLHRTVEELKKSSPLPVLAAVFFLFISYWIRAYRWQYLFSPIKRLRVWPLRRRSRALSLLRSELLAESAAAFDQVGSHTLLFLSLNLIRFDFNECFEVEVRPNGLG